MSSKLPLWIEGKALTFKCTGCGACCTGSPGFVWLTTHDMERLSKHFDLTKEEFLAKYCRKVGSRYSLLEDSKTYDCVFLKGNKCSLYNARPKQCRTYPFWSEVIKSKDSWDLEQLYCEGINHPDGEPILAPEILERMDQK
jgi:Fe-S-cluster containining protein